MAVGSLAVEQLEHRLRADDAVIVLELVGELQRAARLAFRLLGERDGRRLVRDGGELPGDVARGRAAHGRRAGVVDDEAALLGALGVAALRAGGRLGKPAACDHVEVNSGRADDQHASRRHREGGGALHRLARPQARQDHRRAAGIGRRADPGIDAEIGRHHHALPIERRGDALHPFTAGGEERRDHQHRHQGAHGEGIAQREPRHRSPGLERVGRAQGAFDMGVPQRDRIGVFGRCRDLVCDRGGGPMRQAGIAIEPSQTLDAARHAQHQHRRERSRRQQEEDAEADGAAGRRQPKPEAKPRDREEQADDGRDRRQRRP